MLACGPRCGPTKPTRGTNEGAWRARRGAKITTSSRCYEKRLILIRLVSESTTEVII